LYCTVSIHVYALVVGGLDWYGGGRLIEAGLVERAGEGFDAPRKEKLRTLNLD